jgi:putative FmdB family regulatory protein
MPVYEYQCKQCSREFEYEQRMSDPEKTVCEACGGALERLISRTAFHLKGGGWYKDLYASAKPEKAEKADKAGEAKAGDSAAPAAATPAAATPAAAPAASSSASGASSSGSSSSGSSSGGSSGTGAA